MKVSLSAVIAVPIDEVFAYFDDPRNTLEFTSHAKSFDIVTVEPDGRRTIDVHMRSGAKTWTQTIEQVVRDPPTRLATRGWTWTTDRNPVGLSVTTDRRFLPEGDGARLDVTVEYVLEQPMRRPFWALVNRLQEGGVRLELEQQLRLMAGLIEARHRVQASGGIR
jgi:hypothetical protein